MSAATARCDVASRVQSGGLDRALADLDIRGFAVVAGLLDRAERRSLAPSIPETSSFAVGS